MTTATRSERPLILLVEDDDDARPGMRSLLEGEGYDVALTIDERDAASRVADIRHRVDLILLNQGMPVDEVLAAGRRIRAACEPCDGAPVVVIASDYGDEEEGADERYGAKEWVTYLEDAAQLQTLLRRLLDGGAGDG